jgi:hypothetical protein
MVTPALKREAVAQLRTAFDMSERRAAGVHDDRRSHSGTTKAGNLWPPSAHWRVI